MIIRDIKLGYDDGGIPGKKGDGYLNVELELEVEGETRYLWMSRSMEYEAIMVAKTSMFSTAMHMTHYDSDFELEYGFLEKHRIAFWEYDPLEFPEKELEEKGYLEAARLAREELNRYTEYV